jgi:peptidoglycan/LPS O-acetylase OafA/YrhL
MKTETVSKTSRAGSVHLPSLQILRFVAAFLVVLSHAGSGIAIEYGLLTNPFGFGAAGVDIFFVLSGFIISYTSDPARGFTHFARRRIARVVPLYWILTVALIVVALVKPSLLNSTVVTSETILKSFFFIPFEKPNGLIQPILFLGWTLCYEMFFYMIFGACFFAGRWSALLASGIILFLVSLHMMWPEGSVAWRFYTNPILIEFVIGITLHKIFMSSSFARNGSAIAATLALACAVLVQFVFKDVIGPRLVTSSLFATLVVAAFLLWKPPQNALVTTLVLLGDASYALYLIHPYFLQIPIKLLGGHLQMPAMIVLVAGMTVLTVLLSIALYKLVERPFQSIILQGNLGNNRRSKIAV